MMTKKEIYETQTIIDDYNDGTWSVWFTDDINDSSSGSSVRGTAEELIEQFADDIETLALLNEKINFKKL
jgi:hypothetical protein